MSIPESTLSRISIKYRSERSASDNSPDELKSGLQKYIRRDIEDKALRCATELYCFRLVGGKAIYTNLIHRLMIIYLEDIGPANYELWILFDLLLTELRLPDGKRSRQALCYWVSAYCKSTHSRILDHLGSVYKLGCMMKIEELTEHGLPNLCKEAYVPEDNVLKRINAEIPEYPYFQEGYRNKKGEYIKADSENVRTYVHNMLVLLGRGKDGAMYWMYRIMVMDNVGRHNRSTKPASLIFDVLRWYSTLFNYLYVRERDEDVTEMIDRAERWYRELSNLKESILCVSMCVYWFVLVFKKEEGRYDSVLDHEPEITLKLDTEKDVFSHVGEEIVLDDYVLDMHTKRGRKLGKNRKTFAEEGSLVVNEDKRVSNDKYKRFYDEMKKQRDIQ